MILNSLHKSYYTNEEIQHYITTSSQIMLHLTKTVSGNGEIFDSSDEQEPLDDEVNREQLLIMVGAFLVSAMVKNFRTICFLFAQGCRKILHLKGMLSRPCHTSTTFLRKTERGTGRTL